MLIGLSTPALFALLDCLNRDEDAFAEGREDRRSWVRWLIIAVFTCPLLVGNGIVLGYYWAVIKRNQSGMR